MDLGEGTDLSFAAHGLALDAVGNALWSCNASTCPQGILMLTGPLPAELTVLTAR